MVIFYMIVTYQGIINVLYPHYLIWPPALFHVDSCLCGDPDADSILSAIAEEKGEEGSYSANIFLMLSLPSAVGF